MVYEMLIDPSEYVEPEISKAMVEELETLFPGYEAVNNSRVVDHTWKPDFVGYSQKENAYLVGELKCKRYYWTYNGAIKQLVRYGCELYEARPNVKIRLLLVGHWTKEVGLFRVGSFAGYPTLTWGYINMGFLGTLIECDMRSSVRKLIKSIPICNFKTAYTAIHKEHDLQASAEG